MPERVAAAVRGLASPVCAYVYDPAVLAARVAALRAALPGVTVCYAVKANGHPAIVAAAAAACDGLEVASGGELALAEAADARRIVFGGPAKTDAELAHALRLGATVNVESPHELRRLSLLADRAGTTATITLRVNRAGAALPGTHAMTGAPTPFGVDEAQLPEVVALARSLPGLDLAGWHLHAVSNNLDAAAHSAFLAEALRWSAATSKELGVPLRTVNAGGGFGVDYTGGAAFPLDELRVAVPEGVELVVEPGRWLAADTGWYAAEVLDLKHTHGRWFAVLRGGTHHFRLPAAWGYSHPFTVLPVERWDYPWARPEVGGVAVDAAGELCTPRDVLTRGQEVDRLRAGDVLLFARTGAYGWDISHHGFLRHPQPDFVVLDRAE
ncbi:staphyloferrin B biosynthesis decarboxylase SbnH [Catellatospora bangladeshensis]|uniref:Staphyloferrin B biosynthesis decarboxylase SbnH n=1 Tax=Catellatospora bangladeshensis TaxID=310355 RepID=A0A8J3JQU8_9ACTN|nr:staphyloferrin B biosynthesis decarboxylase SbnH [Catellatospora bangladeshensis]